MNVWDNPEAMDLLRARAEAGDSASQIAAALAVQGFVVSRNAVIGKALRAGIKLMGAPTRPMARQCEDAIAQAREAAKVAHLAAPRVVGVSLADSASAGWPGPRGRIMPFPSSAAVPLTAAPEDGPRPPCPLPGEVAAVTILAAAPAAGVPLIGLPWDRCRWPVAGDGAGLLVCGAQAEHRAYCRAHGRLAYQPLPTPLRLPAGASAPRVRSEERETDLVDVLGEAV